MAEDQIPKRSRALGEVLDYLLGEFENNPNPTPEARKAISEKLGMSEKAVRIWFQNRRAKQRKLERMNKVKPEAKEPEPKQEMSQPQQPPPIMKPPTLIKVQTDLPAEISDNYCLMECLLLSVGLWQRLKQGEHDLSVLQQLLVNLLPNTINQAMDKVDLMVILSKRNMEINYFFKAVADLERTLFRIFYPVSAVLKGSLIQNPNSCEIRLFLNRKPKFSVFFPDLGSPNQWSICEDFSEAQQVSTYHTTGVLPAPHVLVGFETHLQYLNSFIAETATRGDYVNEDWLENQFRHMLPMEDVGPRDRELFNATDFFVHQPGQPEHERPREENEYNYPNQFGFSLMHGQEYASQELVHSSELNANTPAGHVDTYIDYNASSF